MDKSVAVIIPAYNVEKWIGECLHSVVSQKVPFSEVIIIDDGSQDDTLSICKKYAMEYPYISIIEQRNNGQGYARNIGIRSVTSDYFIFLDADDLLSENAHSYINQHLTEDVDAVYYNGTGFGEAMQKSQERDYIRKGRYSYMIMKGQDFFLETYPWDYKPVVWLTCYKTEFVKKNEILFPEHVVYEDNYFAFRFMMTANKVIHIDKELYIRRYRYGSTMLSSMSDKKICDLIFVFRGIWKFSLTANLEKKYYVRQYLLDTLQQLINVYKKCNDCKIELSKETVSFFYEAIDEFSDMFLGDITDLELWRDDNKLVLFQISSWVIANCEKNERYSVIYHRLFRWAKSFYYKLFKKMELDHDNLVVGIYGVGRGTNGMLDLYSRLCGKIKATLVFYDTYKKGEQYREQTVLDFEKEKISCGKVVICSCKAHDFIKELIKEKMPKIEIIDVNEKVDISVFEFVDTLF